MSYRTEVVFVDKDVIFTQGRETGVFFNRIDDFEC